MNEHSMPKPAATGDSNPTDPDPEPTDFVAGDPPVPITVWRTARDCGNATIPARLAYRLVSAYSRPGEAVVDLTDGHALTEACRSGGRRHHKAWFTDASAVIIGPPMPWRADTGDDAPSTDSPEAAEPAAWFGDDLTDPDLPPHGEPAAVVDDISLAGNASLVVASWPLHTCDEAANRIRLAYLLTACTRLLGPGGCLVLVVGVPTGSAVAPEDFTPVVAAASEAGLGYLQHIVAVTADTDGDRFTYHATDEELLTLATAAAKRHWYLHVKVHADLLVFTQPTGGGRRD